MTDNVLAFEEFTGLKLAGLDDCDIAILNLCAARGLPDTETLEVDVLLDKLDEWARQVKVEIWRHLYRFEIQASQPPTEFSYGNSLGRFFCWYMLQVLQEDCGVAYHPDRKFNPDCCRPEDLFIHGIVDENGKGGTCASMPVVYVAVARRLGLPVYLVETRGHLFFRWDAPHGTTIHWDSPPLDLWIPPDRFNVEGSGEGIAYYADSHYIQWPELWTQSDFEHERYLRSMSAKEVFAAFLIQRAECFHALGKRDECMKAIYFARQLIPNDRRYEWLHAKRTKELRDYEVSMDHLLQMEQKRRATRKALPGVRGHSPNCQCLHCEQSRDLSQFLPVAPHGPSCQCWHCREAREATEAPLGMPGHPLSCQCAGCLNKRTQPHPIHVAATHQIMRRITTTHATGPANVAQPNPDRLPGI
ncbi:MAG TPA: transglutaminase family protein [Planctomycetaceae bacterium]|nr:transglutaminase family protein [Planctomycetaceae bacterium]